MSEVGHAAPPGAVAVAVAVQVTVVPDSVPWAVPVIGKVPRHFAVNAPEPVSPGGCVTVQ